METTAAGSQPTPEEARRSLELAAAEEEATLNPPVPGWYYPLLAGLLLVICVLNAVEDPVGPLRVVVAVAVVALAVTVAALVGRMTFHRPGYRRLHIRWVAVLPGGLVALALAVAALLLQDVVGRWVWVVAGVALAVLVLLPGLAYWRRYPRA
ncbi:hypothetical protein [Auraticoccus monumenti]|uniref:Uncharacterized protein n=1 Tax=Auraticoccus monumenti TaxID=675864 RepID=A0A1G6XU59_9ACTN|nr:hypothetical protein [Auraticoccus monumenti]SDD81744.1 hypothetical protein SAMN04489747_1812 [Auraticoccus monumenti]